MPKGNAVSATTLDLDAIDALANAASSEPWTYDDGITDDKTAERGKSPCIYAGEMVIAEMYGDDAGDTLGAVPIFDETDANGRFIIAARAIVQQLTAEVRRLREALEERESDMYLRIRRNYDKTVADCWRAEVVKRDAEIARLKSRFRPEEK